MTAPSNTYDNLLTLIAEHAFNDLVVTLYRMPSKTVPVSLRIDGAIPYYLRQYRLLLESLLSHPLGQATINQGCNNGTNPLMIAILRRDYHMIKHLLEAGANVDIILANGTTPLMHACKQGDLFTIKHLLPFTRDINAVDNHHFTALTHAVCTNQYATLPLLFEAGAQLDIKDCYEYTPLMHAIKHGSVTSAMWLIENHASINETNDQKRSALIISIINQRTPITQTLLKKSNLAVNQTDRHQQTALMYACMHGCTDTVKQLINHPHIDIHLVNTARQP